MMTQVKRLLGIDTRADEYRYTVDPDAGYISARTAPSKWVSTTCGYCSVGCGMFVGVRDGRAVAVRGNPDHPVNHGVLCPKGLSEHHTIDTENRARFPLMRRDGRLARVGWQEALGTMAATFRDVQERYGRDAVGVISTGQRVTEEFYARGKLVQLGIGTRNYDGNTTLCMSTAVAGDKRSFGSDGPRGRGGPSGRRRSPAPPARTSPTTIRSCAAGSKPIPAPRSSSSIPGSPRRRCWPTSICQYGRAPIWRCSTV